MEWVVIVLPIIQQMIQRCAENNRAAIFSRGQDRRDMAIGFIWRAVRQADVPRRERKRVRREMRNRMEAMSESEFDQFCTNCLEGSDLKAYAG